MGEAFRADLTVVFFRKKVGHLTMPGLERCGRVEIVDIGITASVLSEIVPMVFENDPVHWRDLMPQPHRGSHKYQRGHLGVIGGNVPLSGAARLAARAGLRSGAGLVTTLVPAEALMVYAAGQTAVMSRPFATNEELDAILEGGKFSGFLIGPGNGADQETARRCLALLESGKPIVIDADGLTAFEENPDRLIGALHDKAVVTPHNGEYKRVWPQLDPQTERLKAAEFAAKQAGAVMVLKGPDTIIAAPDGRVIINAIGPSGLATAGAGDVLAGIIGGLMAAGMGTFAAAAAGTWIHSEAANLLGPGMISEDIVEAIPAALEVLDLGL